MWPFVQLWRNNGSFVFCVVSDNLFLASTRRFRDVWWSETPSKASGDFRRTTGLGEVREIKIHVLKSSHNKIKNGQRNVRYKAANVLQIASKKITRTTPICRVAMPKDVSRVGHWDRPISILKTHLPWCMKRIKTWWLDLRKHSVDIIFSHPQIIKLHWFGNRAHEVIG